MLKLVTDSGEFDLFGDETIVQTFSIFNLEDITQRGGEYTNSFKLPKTNNNINIIRHASYINSVDIYPYSKIQCDLYIEGILFRSGFLELVNIDENINFVFYSGNSNFYKSAKNKNLTDLDWSDFNHVWSYVNAFAAASSTTGYFYPVCDYNGQTLAGNIVNIKLILPSTYVNEILDRIFTQLNYTYTNNFDTTDLDLAVVPYSSKVLTVSTEVQLINKVDLSNTIAYFPIVPSYTFGNQTGFFTNTLDVQLDYNTIDSGSSNYDFVDRKFTAQYEGTYNYALTALVVDYDYVTITFDNPVSQVSINVETRLQCIKVSNGVETILQDVFSNQGYFSDFTGTPYTVIPALTNNFFTDDVTGSIDLSVGDELKFRMKTVQSGVFNYTTAPSVTVDTSLSIASTNVLNIDLQPELVFGGLITYSSMLPNIKCSDFLKDICVRYGLILSINEFDKTINIYKLDTVVNNADFYNWTDKLSEDVNDFSLDFKFDFYGKISNVKHKEDKTIASTPNGSNYQLIINNDNLENEKDIYTSVFGVTENTTFGGYLTSNINLYDTIKLKFNKDITYRICYSYAITGAFKFTDTVTTSAFINTRAIYFVDESKPNLSMGFGLSLFTQNSQTIISALNNLKVLKCKMNLNILDIFSLDYLKPVYLEQHNAYFFISSINQFNYTEHDLTEVELIKLN